MNKYLLEQQIDSLRVAETKDLLLKASIVVQFCFQQLLAGNSADSFATYIISQYKVQQIFEEVQDMITVFLETYLKDYDEPLRQKIVLEANQTKNQTKNYIKYINEIKQKNEAVLSKESQLKTIERDIKSLEEEQQFLNQKIQELKTMQEELSKCDVKQLEENLEKRKEKVKQEREQRSHEEIKEKQLAKELEFLKNDTQIVSEEIENINSNIQKKVIAILNSKKESANLTKEQLQKLELREQLYTARQKDSMELYLDIKKHLSENERILDKINVGDILSNMQWKQLEEIKKNLEQQMNKFEKFGHLLNDQISVININRPDRS